MDYELWSVDVLDNGMHVRCLGIYASVGAAYRAARRLGVPASRIRVTDVAGNVYERDQPELVSLSA